MMVRADRRQALAGVDAPDAVDDARRGAAAGEEQDGSGQGWARPALQLLQVGDRDASIQRQVAQVVPCGDPLAPEERPDVSGGVRHVEGSRGNERGAAERGRQDRRPEGRGGRPLAAEARRQEPE